MLLFFVIFCLVGSFVFYLYFAFFKTCKKHFQPLRYERNMAWNIRIPGVWWFVIFVFFFECKAYNSYLLRWYWDVYPDVYFYTVKINSYIILKLVLCLNLHPLNFVIIQQNKITNKARFNVVSWPRGTLLNIWHACLISVRNSTLNDVARHNQKLMP